MSDQPDPSITQKIEKAVLETFSLQDYHQVNMRAIAKVSGISLGTIYKYYHSKDELLFHFIDKWSTRIANRMIEHLQGLEITQEKIRKVCWVVLDFYEKNHEIGKVFFMTIPMKNWMAHRSYKQKKLTDVFINVLKEGQQKGDLNSSVRAGILMDFIWGILMRSFTMWVYRGQKDGLASQNNILFDMIWGAVSNPQKRWD